MRSFGKTGQSGQFALPFSEGSSMQPRQRRIDTMNPRFESHYKKRPSNEDALARVKKDDDNIK
jgi:hypothetical protein